MDDVNTKSSNDITTSSDGGDGTFTIQLLVHGSGEVRCLGYTLEEPVKNIIKGQCEGWLGIEKDELILLVMEHDIGPMSCDISFTSFTPPEEVLTDAWKDGLYVMHVDFEAYKHKDTYTPVDKKLLN